MGKKKTAPVFVFLILAIILLLLAVLTYISNIFFSGDRVPKVGEYYLYLQESDELSPDVPQNSLVFAKEATDTALLPGNKVLCYLASGNLAMRAIYNIDVNEDGTTYFYPGTNEEQGSELAIPRTNIIAQCKWASCELYTFVQFATSVAGLMCLLVAPCVILIIMLLVKIAKSSREEIDDEDFFFDEEEAEQLSRKPAKKAPLFDPEQAAAGDEVLEKKKESIADNFASKPVNEDSPYQKAVAERTAKFKKVEQEDIDRVNAEQAAREAGTQVYSTAEVEESARRNPNPVSDTSAAVRPIEQAPAPAPKVEKPAEPVEEKHYSSPNIDDIINAAELRAAKSGTKINPDIAATDSIDDLISALEKEKNKL